MDALDPHQRPPLGVRNVYKKYQRMKLHDLDQDAEIVDLHGPVSENHRAKITTINRLDPLHLNEAFSSFAGGHERSGHVQESVQIYEHEDMPGLHVIPNLLPPEIQSLLLSRLLHRDLSSPAHLTNIHTHYNLTYPLSQDSFFSLSPDSREHVAVPLDPSVHHHLGVSQLLNRKLRWMTLGGQYDWTAKRYPDAVPPAFPPDIKALLGAVFQDTKAEAAIVNLYSPGDTLSVHRDVAESCATGLVSISLGCDAIFLVGTETFDGKDVSKEQNLALRLRSGSAVYMSGQSRFAWHGVPQIVPETCPKFLEKWPGNEEHGKYRDWEGWMAGKRVNLNVRQMWA